LTVVPATVRGPAQAVTLLTSIPGIANLSHGGPSELLDALTRQGLTEAHAFAFAAEGKVKAHIRCAAVEGVNSVFQALKLGRPIRP
jgi:hypothetical protein